MRPVVLAWLARHGLPSFLLLDYFQLAAVACVLGSMLALRQTARDGGSRVHAARAIACAYVGALVGGYLFEALREIPAALAFGGWHPITHAGRAAYGGLLFAIVAAAAYLKLARLPLGPFFDSVSVGTGLTFTLVRTGCFLAGCDYGVPTALPWGVRFPPGSLAAVDHARRGLVPFGAASLPVHPTQLYEAALGAVAAGVAALVLRRSRRRDGRAFAAFLLVYACGRFLIELLRGDHDRGHALGLSTSQWVSLAIVVALAALAAAALRSRQGEGGGFAASARA